MRKKILVVIPTYNCEKQIARLLSGFNPDIQKYIDTIVIINNQSKDDTENVAIDALKKIKNVKSLVLRNYVNYGYGGSLKIGFEFAIESSFDWVIVINGDDQSPISDFLPILQSHKYEQYDVMWGCRFLKEAQMRNYSFLRKCANYIFNVLFSISLKKPIHDIGCGVYMYSTKILKDRFYSNVPDVLHIGTFLRLIHDSYNHKFIEFPISWNSDDQESTVKIFSQTFAQFKLALEYFIYKEKIFSKNVQHYKTREYLSDIVFSSSPKLYDRNVQKRFVF